MTSAMIEHVACAVRDGPESRETASSAIDRALKAEAKLSFFHVVDPDYLDCGDIARTSAAYREYTEKAESAMRALCTQARQRGVAHVDFVLREADTRQELRQLAIETDAELLVFGHPNLDSERSAFSPDEFHQFLAELDFVGGLRTIQARLPQANEAQHYAGMVGKDVCCLWRRGVQLRRRGRLHCRRIHPESTILITAGHLTPPRWLFFLPSARVPAPGRSTLFQPGARDERSLFTVYRSTKFITAQRSP